MGDAATLLSTSFTTRLNYDGPAANDNALKNTLDVQVSWSPVEESPRTHREDYSLVFLDVSINGSSVEREGTENVQRYVANPFYPEGI